MRLPAIPDGRYDLADLVDAQAAILRGQDSAPFAMMADRLAALASEIRLVKATTVDEAEGRIAALESSRLYDAFNDGFRQAEMQLMGND